MKIEVHPQAKKELLRIPKKFRLQIVKRIDELEKLTHPLQHPRVKKLVGRKFEEFRLRSGDYRIKFIFIKPDTIKIIHIQHRKIGY